MAKKPSERYLRFYGPILDALRALGGSATPREVKDHILAKMRFSKEELSQKTATGWPAIENEIAWARQGLVNIGLLDNSRRGVWSSTPEGSKARLTVEQARKYRTQSRKAVPKDFQANENAPAHDHPEEHAQDEILHELPNLDEDNLVPGGTDPTYRIKKLEAANMEANGRTLETVTPNCTIQTAVTKMLAGDFSQLPVMNGKTVRGVISWKSLGYRLSLNVNCKEVQEAMDDAAIVSTETSIFEAIHQIVDKDYVLVQAKDKTITGIVTTSDLSVQFRTLAEPFLILGEIENHLRDFINARFKRSDIQDAKDPSDVKREIKDASDITFGEYIRLLENEAMWDKLHVPLDRKIFTDKLKALRDIRNDVMHFDPEGIKEQDIEALRSFVKFLQELRRVGVF